MDIQADMHHEYATWTWSCSKDLLIQHGSWTMNMHGCRNDDKKLSLTLLVFRRAGHALFFTLRACAFGLLGGALRAGAFALFFGP